MNAAPRADALQAAGRGGGRRLAAGARHRRSRQGGRARRARATTRWRGGRWSCCGSRWTPRRRARRRARRRGSSSSRRSGGGGAPASSCRCSRSARRPAGGWARSRTSRKLRRRGRGAPGFSVLQLLPVNARVGVDPSPYAAQLGVRARSRLPVARRVRGLRRGGRARRAARRAAGSASRPRRRRRWSTGGAVRALKRAGDRAGVRALPARRVAASSRPRAQPPLGVHARANRDWLDDYALFAVLHAKSAPGLARLAGRRARARSGRRSPTLRREHADALLREQWLQWQLDLQWRQARREASAAGVELMGDLPFVVGLDSADVWANRSLFRLDQRLGTPPDEGSPDGQDWGLPVYDWERDGARRASPGSGARASARRASSTACSASTTRIGYYRSYFRSTDGKPRRLHARPTSGIRSSSASG